MDQHPTSSALLEQLVYIDTFVNASSLDDDAAALAPFDQVDPHPSLLPRRQQLHGIHDDWATPNMDIDGQLSLDLAAFADDSFIFPDEDKKKDDDNEKNEKSDNTNNSNTNNNTPHPDRSRRYEKQKPVYGRRNKTPEPKQEQFTNEEQFANEEQFTNIDPAQDTQNSQNINENVSENAATENNAADADAVKDANGPGAPGPIDSSSDQYASNITPSPDTTPYSQPKPILNSRVNLAQLPKFPVPPGAKSSLVSAGLSQNQIDLLSALIAQHQTSLGNFFVPTTDEPSRSSAPFLPSQRVRQHTSIDIPSSTSTTGGGANSSTNTFSNDNQGSTTSSSPEGSVTSSALLTPPGIYSRSHSHSGSISGGGDLDKRRRNTAASARFRIKKKLKEKQMESRIESLNDLVKNFEQKIEILEMENKLLKNLIIEKGSKKNDDELRLLKERAKLN